jgi:transposase
MSKKSRPRKDWREERRMRAWELHQQGWTQQQIAKALGVTQGAVSQWLKQAREQGVQALKPKPRPGAKPKLSREQQAQLPALLKQGAEAFGFRGKVWTTKRVAQMIKQQFGVSYHPAHCSRLLRNLKWSQQKPIEKATQRDEAAIGAWKEQRWEELKNQAKAEERTMVFVDETSFYLLPMAVSTYAPMGQTPVLEVKLTRDHLSAIGGITPEGRIFMQMQDHSYKGPDVVHFLQLLLREIVGKILVIWDGASIHRCQAIKEFLAKGGAKRIRLERLPGYAPELNPQEGVWNLLKRVELKNLCCLSIQQVQREVLHAKERLRHHKSTLSQCFAHAGYSF